MDVFSAKVDPIELIYFALCQATQGTNLGYTQHKNGMGKIPRFFGLTPFVGPLKIFVCEKNWLKNTS